MNGPEALAAAMAGKKVCHPSYWKENMRLVWDVSGFGITNGTSITHLTTAEIGLVAGSTEGWLEYIEPKPVYRLRDDVVVDESKFDDVCFLNLGHGHPNYHIPRSWLIEEPDNE